VEPGALLLHRPAGRGAGRSGTGAPGDGPPARHDHRPPLHVGPQDDRHRLHSSAGAAARRLGGCLPAVRLGSDWVPLLQCG